MDRFEPVTGGHRLRLDDFMLMQSSVAEAIKGIVSSLHPTMTCMLSGGRLTVSNGKHSITTGFMSFLGEVFRIVASDMDFQQLPQRPFLKIKQTSLYPSPVAYQYRTIAPDVHFERVMVLKYFNTNDGDEDQVNGIYYDELFPASNMPKGVTVEWEPGHSGEENEVFDDSGLGIGRMRGWAICNGLNGTRDLRGHFTFMPSSGAKNAAPLLPNSVSGVMAGQRLGKTEINILQSNLPSYNLTVIDPGHAHKGGSKSGFIGNRVNDASAAGSTQSIGTGAKVGSGTLPKLATAEEWTEKVPSGIVVQTGGGNQPITNVPPACAMYKISRIV